MAYGRAIRLTVEKEERSQAPCTLHDLVSEPSVPPRFRAWLRACRPSIESSGSRHSPGWRKRGFM